MKDAGEWQQQRFCSVCYFLYPTFREVQKALRKKKAREIACWFESYAQNTVSFEKLEQELGKGASKKTRKNLLPGDISGISR